ncbi:CHAT domain-containing protein [Arcicella aurantiaca]|uniref:CHAT domain-containing protein n=1 Tax=Arcicella aurantiaca TaxID=591202 RepID=A0A316ED21_9BACT|nr:CHAT domain-containing protein [Arcicella aurantiaca]PWK27909.1 CHAT domain-containing protein [Arcicella aurantiaca]
MLKGLFLIGFLVLINTFILKAQCISEKDISNKITFFNENSITVKDSVMLFLYKTNYEKCNYKKDSCYAKILYLIGLYYFQNQKFSESLSFSQQALSIFNLNSLSYIKSLNSIADSKRKLKHYQESINIYLQVISKAEYLSLAWHLSSNAHRYIANIQYRSGEFQKAIESTILGEKIGIKANQKQLVVENLRERAKALNGLNRTQEAEDAINRAIEQCDTESNLAILYQTRGFIFVNKKDYKGALESFLLASSLFQKYKDYINFNLTCIDIGFLYYDSAHDYEKALFYYNLGLNNFSNSFTKVQLYDNIGAVYWKQKNFKKALAFYQKALTTKDFFKFDNPDITTLPSVKDLQIADYKRTFLIILEDKALAWLDYYKFQHNKKHLQNALDTYKTADRMIDIMRWEQTGEQSKLFWRKKTRSIYQNAIETCFLLNKPEEAFYFFEKSRAVMLNDRLKELGAKQLLSPEDQQQESKYQLEVDNARKLVNNGKINEENQQKLLNAENAQTTFLKQIELKNPTYYRYKYDTSTVNIRDLRRKLKDQSLVEYFVGEEVVYAFVLSQNTMKLHQIKANNYGSVSNEILAMMADENALNKQFVKYLRLSNQFYTQFVKPLALPKGRVSISPDGVILPFSALSFSPMQAEYLVKDYAFSYTYSAKFLNQNKEQIASKSFLGIAPVSFKNNQLKLTGSDVSLQKIASHFSSPQLLLNEKASRRSFLEMMDNYQIVQLYTHALANDTTAQLYFADSIIKASELTTKTLLPTELMVLSACQTGIGKEEKGEGIFSLARSFAMLGIPSTLTTLWEVDNQATYQITELFYQYLAKGLPKDLALQKAQNEYLSQNTSGLSMPNFWAGYVLIGDSTALDSHHYWIYWVGGIFLLLVLGYFIKKKTRFHKL